MTMAAVAAAGMAAEPPVALSRGRARRPVAGVRVRVLATVLTLTALAMALAGTVSVLAPACRRVRRDGRG